MHIIVSVTLHNLIMWLLVALPPPPPLLQHTTTTTASSSMPRTRPRSRVSDTASTSSRRCWRTGCEYYYMSKACTVYDIICGSPLKKSSIPYFDHITVFQMLYLRTFVKAGARTWCVVALIAAAFTQGIWAPPLTEVQRYSALNAVTRSK